MPVETMFVADVVAEHARVLEEAERRMRKEELLDDSSLGPFDPAKFSANGPQVGKFRELTCMPFCHTVFMYWRDTIGASLFNTTRAISSSCVSWLSVLFSVSYVPHAIRRVPHVVCVQHARYDTPCAYFTCGVS